ncbi:hypothetical protein KCP73_23425 [Salmonella enterica subsp. enterica]|nr:hypothetical protein KCP73_23425 [Salmonella enterica subsp. enterica]
MPATAILRWSWRQYGLRMNASTILTGENAYAARARNRHPAAMASRYGGTYWVINESRVVRKAAGDKPASDGVCIRLADEHGASCV